LLVTLHLEAFLRGPHRRPARTMYEDFAMTFEILHLTAQIQRWLNRRVARHLAEQAERLAR
jgi:EAL domain-containing protein (putative c-di-GMP-specific phosphodiesterase class I)